MQLRRQFDVVETQVELAGRVFRIHHPRSADDLISEDDFDRDERLPYWAEVWPSSRVLAARVAGQRGDGRTLLDLGCGAGLVSLVAAAVGFKVLAVDYYHEALEFLSMNARLGGLAKIAVRHVDWRTFPDDLGRFDVVAASDVLYERSYAALVADAFARSLAPGGVGLMSDPGRRLAATFSEECSRRSLSCETVDRILWTEGPSRPTVEVMLIRRLPKS